MSYNKLHIINVYNLEESTGSCEVKYQDFIEVNEIHWENNVLTRGEN